MANEEKYRLPVDVEGFAACMREQKERSRAGGKAREGVALKFEAAETAHLQRGGVPTTDDRPKCEPSHGLAVSGGVHGNKGHVLPAVSQA